MRFLKSMALSRHQERQGALCGSAAQLPEPPLVGKCEVWAERGDCCLAPHKVHTGDASPSLLKAHRVFAPRVFREFKRTLLPLAC